MPDNVLTGELIPAGQDVPVKQVRYTEAIADAICDALADGKSIRTICQASDMPDRRTVERWQDANPDFAARCARARAEGAEFHHAEMDRIEGLVLNGALDPKAANVVLSNKRWRMEKLEPKKYGQKVESEVTHKGSVGLTILTAVPEPAGDDVSAD